MSVVIYGRALILSLAILVANTAVAEPGSREDATPWFGLGSISNRILDIQEKIAATQKEMAEALNKAEDDYTERLQRLEAKRRDAKEIGWPLITDSKRDYAERIAEVRQELAEEKQDVRTDFEKEQDELEQEIKDALASPPASTARERMELVRTGTASREAHEVYNALVNLRDSILQLNERLSSESTNYRLASTTYKAQIRLYRYVIQMNQEFRERIDQVYKPGMKELEQRVGAAVKNTKTSAMSEAQKQREIRKLERIRVALQEGYPKLDRHKTWAGRNIETVQNLLDVHETLLENVEIAGDAAALIAEVNSEIEGLDFVAPELIEYDLEASDFEIGDPADVE
ncbi:MAG: hypothetical protein KY410_04705 [Proteobacteria bacterium]|nr:hypothetical protein [Pseudomonadota bacterium]